MARLVAYDGLDFGTHNALSTDETERHAYANSIPLTEGRQVRAHFRRKRQLAMEE